MPSVKYVTASYAVIVVNNAGSITGHGQRFLSTQEQRTSESLLTVLKIAFLISDHKQIPFTASPPSARPFYRTFK